MTWRKRAAPIIHQVIQENLDKPLIEIRKALRAAYPWGERKLHPYRIWCDEVKKQLAKAGKIKAKKKESDQQNLFD